MSSGILKLGDKSLYLWVPSPHSLSHIFVCEQDRCEEADLDMWSLVHDNLEHFASLTAGYSPREKK